eukprot:CAMPEP_0181305686 /NCGR_PEP_ID=MMETSP1101-20121128/9875_1 /TAXON_ID=46948 /ORGANISM="Rhodomonas abbreviata, Strain Caron Lab Isolate" /LENGTH=423 /DNA_ID=CAMNT_0023411645 /DNA_START=60 /DNA_END=1331 /DNA_ORIENTATION=+
MSFQYAHHGHSALQDKRMPSRHMTLQPPPQQPPSGPQDFGWHQQVVQPSGVSQTMVGSRVLYTQRDGMVREVDIVGIDWAALPPCYIIRTDGGDFRADTTRISFRQMAQPSSPQRAAPLSCPPSPQHGPFSAQIPSTNSSGVFRSQSCAGVPSSPQHRPFSSQVPSAQNAGSFRSQSAVPSSPQHRHLSSQVPSAQNAGSFRSQTAVPSSPQHRHLSSQVPSAQNAGSFRSQSSAGSFRTAPYLGAEATPASSAAGMKQNAFSSAVLQPQSHSLEASLSGMGLSSSSPPSPPMSGSPPSPPMSGGPPPSNGARYPGSPSLPPAPSPPQRRSAPSPPPRSRSPEMSPSSPIPTPVGNSSAESSKNEEGLREIQKGDTVLYKQRDGKLVEVEVVAVDHALKPPSYLIRINGGERETERDRLVTID